MNKAALVNFLRHLLFLLILLKFVNSIIILFKAYQCDFMFDDTDFVPLALEFPRHSLFIVMDVYTILLMTFAILIIMTAILGLMGAIYLHRYPLLNFVAGMSILIAATGEFALAYLYARGTSILDGFIADTMNATFEASRHLNPTLRENLETQVAERVQEQIQTISFAAPLVDGWSTATEGGYKEHSRVDYIQMNLKCCGLTGRSHWYTRIPSSCCSEKYQGEECKLDVAYNVGCLYRYNLFRSCLLNITVESSFFGVISIVTAVVALYLARLRVKYPDEDYKSESSSDADDY